MAKSRFGFPQGAPWTPKYPEFATERRATPETAEAYSYENWIDAPETSHVARFAALLDPKGLVEKYNGAIIRVQFKERTKQGKSFYQYFFDKNFVEAERVFELLKNAEHPGEIINSELIAKRVRYEAYG
jgi:hypothetical protein